MIFNPLVTGGGGLKYESGTYVGNNAQYRSISFSFEPKIVFVSVENGNDMFPPTFWGQKNICVYAKNAYNTIHSSTVNLEFSGNTVSLNSAQAIMNKINLTYFYAAIG